MPSSSSHLDTDVFYFELASSPVSSRPSTTRASRLACMRSTPRPRGRPAAGAGTQQSQSERTDDYSLIDLLLDAFRSTRRTALFSAVLLHLVVSAVRNITGGAGYGDSSSPQQQLARYADEEHRRNCQIIYVLGVEGSMHHGFTPVLQKLAAHQVDEETGSPYEVTYPSGRLRQALFGHRDEARSIDDPRLVRATLDRVCPPDGTRRVVIEDSSFPSGFEDDRKTYRVRRQASWSTSTMEDIANSETALNHPTNLSTFYETYSPYADVKFVVLHRPFAQTVASHYDFDGTPEQHSNVVRGFMLLLRRFLDGHRLDGRTGEALWTLVCMEYLTSSGSPDEHDREMARLGVISHLADFLGWERRGCPDCFDHWRPASRRKKLGVDDLRAVGVTFEDLGALGGVWPPVLEDATPLQRCSN